MCIDVVRAILGIVFNDENCRVLPVGAPGDSLDQKPNGVIIIGDEELWGGNAGPDPLSVVIREAHYRKVGQPVWFSSVEIGNEATKFLEPCSQSRSATETRIGVTGVNQRADLSRRLLRGAI